MAVKQGENPTSSPAQKWGFQSKTKSKEGQKPFCPRPSRAETGGRLNLEDWYVGALPMVHWNTPMTEVSRLRDFIREVEKQ